MESPGGLLPVPKDPTTPESLLGPGHPLRMSKSTAQCHGPSSGDSLGHCPSSTSPQGNQEYLKLPTQNPQVPGRFQKGHGGGGGILPASILKKPPLK